MYRRPSVSTRYAPSPRATKNGSPPTAPNARTGELTPPGMRASARSKSDSATSSLVARAYACAPANHRLDPGPGKPRPLPQVPLSRACHAAEPLGGLAREIGQHEVGAGALDRDQVLERDRVAVEPAELRRRFHHGVLAADVERADGDVERVAHRADDVEVGERRLHHDHVGALGDVEGRLVDGLPRVARVHLVAAAIAELRRAFGGVAEGTVQRRGVLRRVS